MPTWIIEPRDPLIVRDGRPFGATPGARATSVLFPFPSTMAGAVRTRAGSDIEGRFDPQRAAEVKQISIAGPLLVELEEEGRILCWLCPAPADALLFEVEPPAGRAVLRRRLVPLRLPGGSASNLPAGLAAVGLSQPDPRKPGSGPRFWRWDRFQQWLVQPAEGEIAWDELGRDGPLREQRTHVRILPDTLAADEGGLFQTRGLEFSDHDRARLALAVVTDAELHPGLTALGGERRAAAWRQSQDAPPACPAALREAIVQSGACRVVLLTPAHLAAGYRPAWLLEPRAGVEPNLLAVAVQRPEVVSGWDLEKGRPKPTRRLAPAGTVLFLSLAGDRAAVAGWVDALWMQCVSDGEQDRRDGFGLAVLGTWSGDLVAMEGIQ